LTPQEKKLAAQLLIFHGILDECVRQYAETKPAPERKRLLYALDKALEKVEQLFQAFQYERTPYEIKQIADFVMRSEFYILGPEDKALAEELAERERRWIEATG